MSKKLALLVLVALIVVMSLSLTGCVDTDDPQEDIGDVAGEVVESYATPNALSRLAGDLIDLAAGNQVTETTTTE